MKCKDLGIVEFDVVWGGDKLSPVQFNFGDVGEVRLKIKPNPDDDFDEVYGRSLKLARELSEQNFEARMQEHLDRVRKVNQMASEMSRAKISR